MGDRTHCTLLVGGEITAAAFAALVAAVTEAAPDEFIGESIEATLRDGHVVEFYEMKYGEPPDFLQKAIDDAGAAYRWSWADGGGYGPGVRLYDPATKETGEYGTLETEIALRVSDIENPDVIRAAERWLNFERAMKAPVIVGQGEGAA